MRMILHSFMVSQRQPQSRYILDKEIGREVMAVWSRGSFRIGIFYIAGSARMNLINLLWHVAPSLSISKIRHGPIPFTSFTNACLCRLQESCLCSLKLYWDITYTGLFISTSTWDFGLVV